MYEYILAFGGGPIFWEVVSRDGYILAGGRWQWMPVGGGGYILDGGEWWCIVVGRGGWWHSLVQPSY